MLPCLIPEVGMEFNTIDEAWMFWIAYGGQKGFEVRKGCYGQITTWKIDIG